MNLSHNQLIKVRQYWKNDPSFLGYPDAERDAADEKIWLDNLLVEPRWFKPATKRGTTIIVGRKGVGKSAARIASTARISSEKDLIVVQASADELAVRHASRLKEASDRGFGAVADWCQVYAELIVRNIVKSLGGTLVTKDDEEAIRKWAVVEGITERDFGERLVSIIRSVVPWAKKLTEERTGTKSASIDRFRRIAEATAFSLYIDDFDNIQENKSINSNRIIRDAIEAADRITSHNTSASIHLLLRQDLWLRLRPGWHYADKVSGLVELDWDKDDLQEWTDKRLRNAISTATGEHTDNFSKLNFSHMWEIFFPSSIELRNKKTSEGLNYIVRRTMYTPRSLRRFLALIIERSRSFPASRFAVTEAEEEFSTDQLEFLKTEYGALCEGLDICLQSFTGKSLETQATLLFKHLKGLIGNGQVRLIPGASDGTDEVSLARFLYRIGFLEVRYPENDRYEVRDAMRHPDHWKSIRRDDAVTWAVRSAFYCALRTNR